MLKFLPTPATVIARGKATEKFRQRRASEWDRLASLAMSMRARAIASALLIAATGAPMALAHPPTQLSSEAEKATAQDVIDFRKALADAIARKDAAALRQMYAESFTHAHGSGKLDGRDARIVAALAGDPVIENAPLSDLVIRVPGGWTAIASGVSPIRSLADGKTYAFRWIAVYIRTDTSWQLAASQATRLQEVK